jgi:hypothetical protein
MSCLQNLIKPGRALTFQCCLVPGEVCLGIPVDVPSSLTFLHVHRYKVTNGTYTFLDLKPFFYRILPVPHDFILISYRT